MGELNYGRASAHFVELPIASLAEAADNRHGRGALLMGTGTFPATRCKTIGRSLGGQCYNFWRIKAKMEISN